MLDLLSFFHSLERFSSNCFLFLQVESIYRNDYHNVKEFLDKKHPGHYWVYNLCSEKERQYDKKKFDGRVSYYAFDDHHPPDFR